MRRTIVLILLSCFFVSFITILISSPVHACTCVPPQPVESEYNRAEAVFVGSVLEVKDQKSSRGYGTKEILFEVSQVLKGGPESQIIVHTGSGGGDCGFSFDKAGKEYLVYTHTSTMYGDEALLVTTICSRTTELSQAQEDIAVLGNGMPPTEKVNLEEEPGISLAEKVNSESAPDFLSPYVWTVTSIVILGLIVYVAWRRVRK